MALIGATGVWGVLALVYSQFERGPLTTAAAGLFGLLATAASIAMILHRVRWPLIGAYAIAFALLLSLWRGLEPSNDRDWQADVAVLPYAEIDGDVITVRNIRNFSYRSETDYVPAYYDRRFELSKLEAVDMITVYWMGPAIAHVFTSFAFAGGAHLAISIETRKERGESYSTLAGFFRRYELFYVVADERDVIRLRTNYRRDPPEDVYIYRTRGSIENGRKVFLEYMAKINALAIQPEFYNSLTTNCTTGIWLHTRVNRDHLPLSWKLLASGYAAEYAYESGRLDTRVPFDELKRRGHVNERARAADSAPDFSRRIREGIDGTSQSDGTGDVGSSATRQAPEAIRHRN